VWSISTTADRENVDVVDLAPRMWVREERAGRTRLPWNFVECLRTG